MRVQLSVGDIHGKLVVEEELEVSLWRLFVWLEDLVTVRLKATEFSFFLVLETVLIPLPGHE
jgi:hypothetical protein